MGSLYNVGAIIAELEQRYESADIRYNFRSSDYCQIRIFGAMVDNKKAAIDIGIYAKGEEAYLRPHEVVEQKFANTEQEHGIEALNTVKANIVLAKQILKKAQAYTRLKEGGIGGIGVETWILAHGGNMLEAFESFYDAAYPSESTKPILFGDFQRQYRIRNVGANLRSDSHVDFTDVITEEGYYKMFEAIGDYLGKS